MDKISGLLDRAIWWSLVAMVVVIPLAETPKTICFISALVFWFAKMAITRDFKIKMPRLGWFLLPWVGATFLSTFNSECGIKGVRDVLTYVPFFLLIVNVVDSERRIIQLFWAVVIGIGIGDVAGLWITISDAVRMHPQLDRLRILSLGSAAPYLVMVLSLIAGLTFQVRWTRGQWLVLGMTVSLSIVALILTYTRSMWIVCVVIMVMFAALQKTWWPSVVAAVPLWGWSRPAISPVIQDVRVVTDCIGMQVSWSDMRFGERHLIVRDHPVLGVGEMFYRP